MTIPYNPLLKPPLGTSLNKSHRLSKNLVGLWLMNEKAGSIVQDLSGRKNEGTIIGSSWVPGKYGSCLDFSGSGQYINCQDKDEFSFTDGLVDTPFTLIAYVNSDQLINATDHMIIGKYDAANQAEYRWMIRNDGGNQRMNVRCYHLQANKYIGQWGSMNAAPVLWVSGQWHMITVTYDGSETTGGLKLYLDGIALTLTTDESLPYTGMGNGTSDFEIGAWWSGGAGEFDGKISCVWAYNRALSAFEIAQLYREPFCMFKNPTEMALLGGYHVTIGAAGIMTTNTGYWGPTF